MDPSDSRFLIFPSSSMCFIKLFKLVLFNSSWIIVKIVKLVGILDYERLEGTLSSILDGN